MSNDFIKPNLKYEIMTPTGWQSFSGIRKLIKPEYFSFTLSTGIQLKCSTTHPFISNGYEVLAKDLEVGNVIDSIEYGHVRVIEKEYVTDSIDLFDIINVDGGSLFIVDNIISHNCDFISSGHTVIDGAILQRYEQDCQEPLEKRGYDNGYWVWEYPNYTKNYIVVADVARGDSADWSAFHVIDVETVTQVAEYKGKIPPNDFGNMLVTVATEWNNALLAIENANIGWAAIQPALDRNYENLFYTYKDDGYVDLEVQLMKGYDVKDKTKMVPGVSTTSRTRPLMISSLEMYMREGSPKIRSKRLIQEMFVFKWQNGKAQAEVGYNDDLVMSFCIGLWLRDTSLKLRQHGIELHKKAISQFTKTNGIISTTSRNNQDTGWSWNNGYGDEDLTWLIK